MEELTPELIYNICVSLIRERKYSTVSNLSATSRRLRAIAQPVLFRHFPTPFTRSSQLPEFIRILIQRPDLAAQVKALQLTQSDTSLEKLDAIADCVRPILEKARHGSSMGKHADFTKKHIGEWLDGTSSPSRGPGDHPRRHWLLQLLLLLVPNLGTLSVASDLFAEFDIFELGNGSLPLLRSMALHPCGRGFHITQAKALLAAAPSLEVLYVTRCGFKDEDNIPDFDTQFMSSLGNLCKLVISDLELCDLAKLLPACPRLQVLQYVRAEREDKVHDDIPLEVLRPVQKTLRTLSFKFTDTYERGNASLVVPRSLRTIKTFRGFAALRELVIEEAAINFPENPPWNGPNVADWLPPFIEKVSFRDIRRVPPFLDQMSILAEEAPTKLPKLRLIRMTPRRYLRWAKDRVSWQPSFDRVVVELEQVGITLVETNRGPWMYPPNQDLARPGWSITSSG